MKIALINGSPRSKESASGCILKELKPFLEKDNNDIYECCFNKSKLSVEEIELLAECDSFVFAFPLYVDGVPSHLLSCLVQLEAFFEANNKKEIAVYSLVNSGFYEGIQNKIALEIMENWCVKTGLRWGQGVGVGAGGMLLSIKNVPVGQGPKKNLEKAFDKLSNNILSGTSEDNIYITANFPRFLYKLSAEMGWRQAVKSNGLTIKDLYLKK